MYGDITRSTFDPDNAYSSVRFQQGRVLTDADWNEQRDIELHDERRLRGHVIGDRGGPVDDVGFAVTATGSSLGIGIGHYYVDGICVELAEPLTLEGLPDGDDHHLVYLQVWERPVTAIEDPTIREVALGGPDTATRTRVDAQVRLLPVTTPDPTPDCTSEYPEWTALEVGGTATVQARALRSDTSESICAVPETAGFTGLENRTYRVEVHDGNFVPDGAAPGATATLKWSRENGSVVAAWTADPAGGVTVQVDRLGPGGTEGFARGDWIECTNDVLDAAGQPGVLAEIDDLSGASSLVLRDEGGLAAALAEVYEATTHPKIRRWDSAGAVDVAPGEWVELEDGLTVRFDDGTLRSGDFWIVPARTAILPGTRDRQIDWPVASDGEPEALRAHGPQRHVARLALVRHDGSAWSVVGDCREQFAPLTDVIDVDAISGDGQQAPSGHWLPAPLRVAVTRGRHPVSPARVRFRVAEGGGRWSPEQPDASGAVPATFTNDVLTTAADGTVQVWWRMGDATPPSPPGDTFAGAPQRLVAELVDADGAGTHVPVTFTATPIDRLVLVDAGGSGQLGRPGETLRIALRARVSAGSTPAEGQHVAFEVASRMIDGDALDEVTGGSLHASDGVIDTEPWPGGSRTVRAVVATDADGVAQVQWILGTEVGLPVQRVLATLLDDRGAETAQRTIYLANLTTGQQVPADEVAWDVCRPLAARLPHLATVQDALDLWCELFGIEPRPDRGGRFAELSFNADRVTARRADGDDALTVDTANGRVGVGTTTPTARLHVEQREPQAAVDARIHGDRAAAVIGRSLGGGIGVFAGSARGIGLMVTGDAQAARFDGEVFVNGDITVARNLSVTGTKSFRIDHPLEPSDRYLCHASVESDEMKNVYDGVVELDDDGRAEVTLPDWCQALNESFRYQLTPLGEAAPELHVAEPVNDNRFAIAGGRAGMSVSWQLTGVRHDPHALAHPIDVEPQKPDAERGRYLSPELYDEPEERGIAWAQRAEALQFIDDLGSDGEDQ